MARRGQPEELVDPVVFLDITGTVLFVDGGYTAA